MLADMLKTRDEYIELIRRELLGPGSEISMPDAEHELISNSPDVRYSIGILFPRDNKLNADSDSSNRVEESAETEEPEDFQEDVDSDDEDMCERPEPTTVSDEDNLDEEIGLAAQNMPSSVGITFFALGDSEKVTCRIKFATYHRALAQDCKIPFYPRDPEHYTVPDQLRYIAAFDKELGCLRLCAGGLTRKKVRQLKEQDFLDFDEFGIFDALYKLCGQLQGGFVRDPHDLEVSLDFSEADYIDKNQKLDGTSAKVTALRRKVGKDLYSITVMLVNDEDQKSNGVRCLFQPEIIISTENNSFRFKEYAGMYDFDALDDEEQSLELQYRNKKVYATGLGTSTSWDINDAGEGVLKNEFFPEIEVPSMDFNLAADSGVKPCALSMKYLSDLDKSPKVEKLGHLCSVIKAYGAWIDGLVEKSRSLDNKYQNIATQNIDGCRKAYSRMLAGIHTLETDQTSWSSFELANRAMFMQRAHLQIQAQTSNHDRFPGDEELEALFSQIDYRTVDSLIHDSYSWRPFQIAFILMSVDSVTKDECEDRNIVDLIWFPTGGGKTEAYLGLTALTIFYRRLSHKEVSAGTTVIMRYTLRLLAAQQFTRASTLICACEYIRQDAISKKPQYGTYALGKEAITIGLWIGGEHTPNKNDKAKKELKFLREATASNLRDAKDKHNKFQVLKCPWCGTKLVKERDGNRLKGEFGYRMCNNSHFELFCPQESCFFNHVGVLPVQIVDEELYANPPTLLFGTVDKFAMLPWKQEIGAFFGIGSSNRAPELIIQDELHLISGPLGTIVGLYETAIDALCSNKGINTKIVASTATIRRAKEQCSALYNREVSQFPHPGIDAEDSFFARESVVDYEKSIFGRKYIGLMPSGKTKAMMEVRSIAAIMQKINTMPLADEVKDKYWTLTVYFNSLKDLGKCSTFVDDDVKDFIKRTAYRLGTARDARIITRADELTSRVSTTELNETLDKLEKWSFSRENIENKRYPSNILLATNMISVGIDVARLNVMLLVGQPKLTSEYIQASSRIGRTYPGVAFTMYDSSKSRDRSHYEQFKPYHESFYKYVEPTGATPFSKPARDRALHAVVIALIRLLEPELRHENGAAKFARDAYKETIDYIRTIIANRSSEILQRMRSGMVDDSENIVEEIDTVLEKWEHLAEDYDEDHFSYGEKHMIALPKNDSGRLMKAFNTDPFDTKAFDTMTSMRNVDATVAGNVLIWER